MKIVLLVIMLFTAVTACNEDNYCECLKLECKEEPVLMYVGKMPVMVPTETCKCIKKVCESK